MPIDPSFTVSQLPGAPSIVSITDTHTGTDVLFTKRRVTLKDSLDNSIVPSGTITDYVQWDILDTSISIDALKKDYAMLIKVDYLDASDNVLATKTSPYPLTCYFDDFDYMLTQMLSVNPVNINNNSFFENKRIMANYVDSGVKAVSRASDIYSAQICFDEATKMQNKKRYFFNING